jgi:hypothetical protein
MLLAAKQATKEPGMSITITLTEDQIDLLLVAVEARREQLREQSYKPENDAIAFTLLDMADDVEALRRRVQEQVTAPEDFEAQMAREAREADEDYAEYQAEHYAEVIAPMIAAERRAEDQAMRDEARYGRDEF